MSDPASVILKKGEGRFLKAGGAWIYDNEIASMEGEVKNGGLVRVLDFDGYGLGTGFLNLYSKIRVRMLNRSPIQPIDRAFLRGRVRDTWEYRKKILSEEDRTACRLIFGEADFLPGLVVDRFSDVLVVQCLALGMEPYKLPILEELTDLLAQDGIRTRGIYERSDAKEREKEGLEKKKGFLSAPFDTKVEIRENGVRYYVDVENGQKTGFFLDQKFNRRAVGRLCRDARVLDCFTHTGSFALNAAVSGAREVLGADASQLAVEQACENARLNGLEDRVRFECCDVFDLLPDLLKKGESYDVVILDPPAFTKSRSSVKNAAKGYREINKCGMQLVRDGGFLATCSCSHFMTYELFTQTLQQAARAAHKRLRQVEYRTQAADHPILWAADASYYLKFYIFQVCDEK